MKKGSARKKKKMVEKLRMKKADRMNTEWIGFVSGVVWLDSADVDSFEGVFIAKKGDSAIRMDLSDSEGAFGSSLESLGFEDLDEDLISNNVIVGSSALIFSEIVSINNSLTFLTKKDQIGDDWNWEEHILLEDNGPRRYTERFVNCTARCMLCQGENSINEPSGILVAL